MPLFLTPFNDLQGYKEGGDLALFAATIGLISGVLFGTVLINWAVRRNLASTSKSRTGIFVHLLIIVHPLKKKRWGWGGGIKIQH